MEYRVTKSRRGMTLIELLISLSIIALMTAIAIPMFSSYQRRASLNSDADAVAQLVEYARSLNANPNYQRYSTERGAYTIKISNDPRGNPRVELYSEADPSIILDSVKLSSYEEIDPSSYYFSFIGKTPQEKIWSCNGPQLYNCPNTLDITLRVKNSGLGKIIRINNSTNNQNFSVEVVNL
ncbi:MAG TPA: prepilin-type N-terminal cleavage/methylation domain-containing protein [bacterium]|nr:prepilin-type N-terminal cleavage/methylation domain-containing protein [bacterium]